MTLLVLFLAVAIILSAFWWLTGKLWSFGEIRPLVGLNPPPSILEQMEAEHRLTILHRPSQSFSAPAKKGFRASATREHLGAVVSLSSRKPHQGLTTLKRIR